MPLSSQRIHFAETPVISQIDAFFEAVRANDADAVRAILQQDPSLVDERIADLGTEPWERADPDARHTNTALHRTCVRGGKDDPWAPLAEVLIGHGADVNAFGFNENKGVAPAVVLAAWEGELEVLQLLLQHGADPNIPAPAESALYTAIEHTGRDEPEPNRVSLLLQAGAALDLFTSAMLGRIDLVEQFLNEDPDQISRRSLKRDRTPLEEAASYGRWETAEYLSSRGAEVAIHAAAAMGRIDLIADILDKDSSRLEWHDDSHETPLLIAARHGRADLAELLLKRGAEAKTQNRWQVTALHYAVASGDARTVQLLLEGGADATQTDRSGKTAFQIADPANAPLCGVIAQHESDK